MICDPGKKVRFQHGNGLSLFLILYYFNGLFNLAVLKSCYQISALGKIAEIKICFERSMFLFFVNKNFYQLALHIKSRDIHLGCSVYTILDRSNVFNRVGKTSQI